MFLQYRHFVNVQTYFFLFSANTLSGVIESSTIPVSHVTELMSSKVRLIISVTTNPKTVLLAYLTELLLSLRKASIVEDSSYQWFIIRYQCDNKKKHQLCLWQ